jgi:hypothetical protein
VPAQNGIAQQAVAGRSPDSELPLNVFISLGLSLIRHAFHPVLAQGCPVQYPDGGQDCFLFFRIQRPLIQHFRENGDCFFVVHGYVCLDKGDIRVLAWAESPSLPQAFNSNPVPINARSVPYAVPASSDRSGRQRQPDVNRGTWCIIHALELDSIDGNGPTSGRREGNASLSGPIQKNHAADGFPIVMYGDGQCFFPIKVSTRQRAKRPLLAAVGLDDMEGIVSGKVSMAGWSPDRIICRKHLDTSVRARRERQSQIVVPMDRHFAVRVQMGEYRMLKFGKSVDGCPVFGGVQTQKVPQPAVILETGRLVDYAETGQSRMRTRWRCPGGEQRPASVRRDALKA